MAAGKYKITIEQGATFQLSAVYKDDNGNPIDITGYSARMQVRSQFDSTNTLLSVDSGGIGGITIDGPNGAIAVEIPATTTEAVAAPQLAVYDLEIQSPAGIVTRLLEGKARIRPEVTR